MEKIITNALLIDAVLIAILTIVFILIYKRSSKGYKVILVICIMILFISVVKFLSLKYFYEETIGVTQRTYYSGKPPRKTVAYYYHYKGKIYHSSDILNHNAQKTYKGDESKYKVRVVTFYPAWDVIDFSQPVESE